MTIFDPKTVRPASRLPYQCGASDPLRDLVVRTRFAKANW
jgi:hypothetical protein